MVLIYLRYEVLTAVKMSVLVFWVLTPYGFADRYYRFGETYSPHHQG
jgi:hypothetical protein